METNQIQGIFSDSSLSNETSLPRKKVGVFIANTIVGSDVFLWTPKIYRQFGKIFPKSFWRYFYRFYYGVFTSPYKLVDRFDVSQEAEAYTLLVLLTGEFMKINPKLAWERTLAATKYAQDVLHADLVCLGSLTKHVTKNGKLLKEAGITVPITHGDSYSVGCSWLDFKQICHFKGWNNGRWPRTAIIGSYGTIGSALARIFAKWKVPQLLIARNEKIGTQQIESLKAEYPDAEIYGSSDLMSMHSNGIQVVITATSDHRIIVRSQHLPRNCIIYEVSQPNNTSPDIVLERPDVERIEGALVTEPPYIRRNFGMRLPLGKTYACAAELLIRLLANDFKDHCDDQIQIPDVRQILDQAKPAGFAPAPFSSNNRDVTLTRNGGTETELEFGNEVAEQEDTHYK